MADIQNIESELKELAEEQRRIEERKRELFERQRQAIREEQERKEREELERPTEVRAVAVDTHHVHVKVLPELRKDVTDVILTVRDRQFDHYTGVTKIPLESWPEFRATVEKLPKVTIGHLLGVEGKIKSWVEQPEFSISLKEKFFLVTYHPKAVTYKIHNIPGASHNREKFTYEVALTEGWRLIEALEGYTRGGSPREIKWEPAALEFAEKEVIRRQKLNTIAIQHESDFDVELSNGHKLRPFQRVGVEFAVTAKGRVLLADQMGLGKTWQAIAFAKHFNARAVIICPAHLKANWSREIIQLTGQTPTILFGREPDQFQTVEMLVNKPQFAIINYDILSSKTKEPAKNVVDEKGISHYTPPKERWLWAELIGMSKPDLIIIDEAHYIKNTDANRAKAIRQLRPEYRIALTGTPVLNRPGEYWSILNWIDESLFPSEGKFLQQYTSDGKNARNVEELRELLKPIMIRRLKKDVVSELPPINRITNLHELSPEARERYKKALQGVYLVIDQAGNEIQKNITSILAEIGRLKQICSSDKVDAVVDLATELYTTEEDASNAKNGNKKVLIFSQYKETVHAIAHKLGKNAISWTGDTDLETRTRLEHKFQTDPDVHYLVVSLMTGQTGLNLTAAGHVIFADLWWTPAAHAQAEERAYGRLSNMHGCDSYYVVAQGTIEEWIQDMLSAKLSVINQVVEGIDGERDTQIGMSVIEKLKTLRGL